MAIHGQSNKFVFDFHGVKHGLIKKIEFRRIDTKPTLFWEYFELPFAPYLNETF